MEINLKLVDPIQTLLENNKDIELLECYVIQFDINPLQSGVAFLHPLKISENLKVF